MTRPSDCSWCGRTLNNGDATVTLPDWVNGVVDRLHGKCLDQINGGRSA